MGIKKLNEEDIAKIIRLKLNVQIKYLNDLYDINRKLYDYSNFHSFEKFEYNSVSLERLSIKVMELSHFEVNSKLSCYLFPISTEKGRIGYEFFYDSKTINNFKNQLNMILSKYIDDNFFNSLFQILILETNVVARFNSDWETLKCFKFEKRKEGYFPIYIYQQFRSGYDEKIKRGCYSIVYPKRYKIKGKEIDFIDDYFEFKNKQNNGKKYPIIAQNIDFHSALTLKKKVKKKFPELELLVVKQDEMK